MKDEKAAKMMSLARTQLIIKQPFFGMLALHLKLVEDRTLNPPTAATDSVCLFYDPNFINSLSKKEVIGLVCHEILHIAFKHVFRRESRNYEKWNIACDHAVNWIVSNQSYMELPKCGLKPVDKYKELTADKIYSMLPEDAGWGSSKNIGDVRDYKEQPDDSDYSKPVRVQEKNWSMNISRASAAAKMQGNMPSDLDKIINDLLYPKLSWKEILARFVVDKAKDDYTWKAPNRRYIHNDIYMPSIDIPTLGTLVVIVDTSGSIGQSELNQFAGELRGILQSYPATKIITIYVDTRVANVEELTVYEFNLHAKGGGGTDFRPGFGYIDKNGIQTNCVIYLTDGYCNTYPKEPDYPTLWAVTDNPHFEPPFGTVLEIITNDGNQ